MPRGIVRRQPLRGKPEKESDIARVKLENQSSILQYAVILGKWTGIWIALVHVYVMDALVGAKLAIDRPGVRRFTGLRELGAKRKQLAALLTQLLQIGDQHILQIIVSTGTSMWDGDSVWPVEQGRPKVVQGRGHRTCGGWKERKPSGDLWQRSQEGMILQWIPLLIPTFDLARLPGVGGEGGDGRTVSIDNPLTDMKRDLDPNSPDIPAVRVTTTADAPRYLRHAVLTEFSDITWRPGVHTFGGDQEATGPLPPPVGLSLAIPTTTVQWQLEYQEGFDSNWLPTPMRLAAIEAGPEWGYDLETLDFHTFDDGADTAGTSYSLTELDVDIDANLLALATGVAGPLRERFTELPSDLTPLVDELAREVTAGLNTQYDQAVALQRWFRTEFEYSLDRASGSGGDALEKFLAPTGRVGYCEQFASAMAVMARSLRIPARVAVGFLSADPVPGQADVWEFSTRDLHAWPELYFEGVGWVIFEPTPAEQTGRAPGYTHHTGAGPDPTETSNTSNVPTTTAPVRDPNESEAPTPEETESQQQEDDESLLLPVLGISAGVLVILVILALTPGWLRRRRTAARWAAATDPAETAWSGAP